MGFDMTQKLGTSNLIQLREGNGCTACPRVGTGLVRNV